MTHGTIISQAMVCDSQPSTNAPRQVRARDNATKSGSSATNISHPAATFGKEQAKRAPEAAARTMLRARCKAPRRIDEFGTYRLCRSGLNVLGRCYAKLFLE